MAGETVITVIGNLVADPELRNTARGNVVNFRVASTPRTYDRQSGQWKDGQGLFLSCSAWDSQYSSFATNIANSLSKGMRVIVQGNLVQRSYQTQSGDQRTVYELHVTEVGPALSRATAQVTRNGGSGNGGNGGYRNNGNANGGYGNYGNSNGGYSGGYNGGSNHSPAPQQDAWGADATGGSDGSTFGTFGHSDDSDSDDQFGPAPF